MNAEKDRLGDKLRDLEHARENQFFAQRDRELIEKLRHDPALTGGISCPACSSTLETLEAPPLRVYTCAAGHGWWLAAEDLDVLRDPASVAALGDLLARTRTR